MISESIFSCNRVQLRAYDARHGVNDFVAHNGFVGCELDSSGVLRICSVVCSCQ